MTTGHYSFEAEYGTDDKCPNNAPGGHQPDWSSLSLQSDGGVIYVDVACKHCGRSGCLGTLSQLEATINW